jgi:hypothetical protein
LDVMFYPCGDVKLISDSFTFEEKIDYYLNGNKNQH